MAEDQHSCKNPANQSPSRARACSAACAPPESCTWATTWARWPTGSSCRIKYECYFFIADWHALTTDYADTSQVAPNTLEVMLDYLAAGLDPEKSVLFLQSRVPQHAELFLVFCHDYAAGLAGARAQL